MLEAYTALGWLAAKTERVKLLTMVTAVVYREPGLLAKAIGAPNVVRLAGAACIVGSAVFVVQLPRLRSLVRPIYVRMGILPEMAAGVQGASELNVPPQRT